MTTSRREFIVRGAAAAALIGGATAAGAQESSGDTKGGGAQSPAPASPGVPGKDYRPVVTPNGTTLPFRVVDGVKIFHLIAEEVEHEFAPGLKAACWGYNGSVHGPTIEAVEGDRVRIYVTNRLPAPTTVHWHGLYVPSAMDGVGGLSQRPIEPKETFKYEFTLRQHGTFMYHSHHDEMVQMALGLMGLFVIHPRVDPEPRVDRDFAFLLSEWAIKPGTRRPDPYEMTDFNVLTFNAAIFPATEPMVAQRGERVRVRIGNLSAMDHHPIHIHGTSFRVVETDGGVIPKSGQWPETTVLVPTGSTRTIELVADNPGDWAVHCHMTHHVMTQMGHGIPNLIGVEATEFDAALARTVPEFRQVQRLAMEADLDAPDPSMPPNSLPMMGGPGPFGYITMGGMFTILKIREQLKDGEDPGFYKPPAGTQADVATMNDLRRDGIRL
jgi:FtsP/CotA-like multicopper oxidase with cupredoxin domain